MTTDSKRKQKKKVSKTARSSKRASAKAQPKRPPARSSTARSAESLGKSPIMPILFVGGGLLLIVGFIWLTSQDKSTEHQAHSAAPGSVTAAPVAASGQFPAPPDVAAPPKDAQKTASGLATKVLKKGTGKERPGLNDYVKVHYTGWTKDGKMFDSSHKRGQPAEFGVGGVIKGWTEALQLMTVGEKRRLWIPAELAYGEKPTRPGGPSGQLTFDVELLEIIKAPDPPKDLAAPPEDAIKTESGLVYRVLKKGTGERKAGPNDQVEVHRTGWSQDGKLLESTELKKRPRRMLVGRDRIKGLSEALQLMVEGDKLRLWIPPDLAFGDKPAHPRMPAGTLVYDLELLKFLSPPQPASSASADASAAASASAATTAEPKAPPAAQPPPPAAKPPAPPPAAKPPAPPPAAKPPPPPPPSDGYD